MNWKVLPPLVLWLLVVLSGCVSAPAPAPVSATPNDGAIATERGYALLYDLLSDEQSVSKLLIIKRERAELRELIKAISERSASAHKQLEAFAKADRRLNLKDMGLPGAEVNARKSISSARAKQLLAAKGKDFEFTLLLTQEEALTYGIHLAQVTAAQETNVARVKFLQQLSRDLIQLEHRLMAMWIANYSLPPSK